MVCKIIKDYNMLLNHIQRTHVHNINMENLTLKKAGFTVRHDGAHIDHRIFCNHGSYKGQGRDTKS